MKRLSLCIIIGLFLITLVSAENIGTYQQGDCIELVQTCANCSYVRISGVSYPNSSQALSLTTMTKTGTYYNHTFCNTNDTGTYKVNGFGDDLGVDQEWAYYFDITPSGNMATTSQGIISIVVIISVLFVMLFFGFLGFKLMDYEKLYGVALFFILLSLLLSVFSMYLGFTYSRDFMFSASTEPYLKLFTTTIYALVGMSFLGLLIIIINTLKELKERKSLQDYGPGYNSKTKTYDY